MTSLFEQGEEGLDNFCMYNSVCNILKSNQCLDSIVLQSLAIYLNFIWIKVSSYDINFCWINFWVFIFSFGNQQKLYLFKTCFTFLSKKRIKKKNKKSSHKVFGFIFGKFTISSSCEIITFLWSAKRYLLDEWKIYIRSPYNN